MAASQAFAKALRDKNYDLRQESLANQGWCLYASAGDGPRRNQDRLKQALATFTTLRQEAPQSDYLDRALFYSGEAAYGLGQAEQAIRFYDQLLTLPATQQSPLRCDALYARGVAHEEIKQLDQAIASYKQLLGGCERAELIVDVQLRMGDLYIRQGKFSQAVGVFDDALRSTSAPEDRSFALFRQAYALVQDNRPGDAAAKYEQLLTDYPASSYAEAATLASAQSFYRNGDMDRAAKRFRQVLTQTNLAASTEAAHWLARIEISAGNAEGARTIAQRQIDAGLDGSFALSLRLDLAEALSMNKETVAESMAAFEKVYRDAPTDALAPRALYNAAFSALQINQPQKALRLALEFITKFPRDTLAPDVRFVAAESQLLTGKPGEAADTYKHLLATSDRNNFQRPLWVLRAGSTCNLAKRFDDAVSILKADLSLLTQPAQRAEAQFLIGQAHLSAGRAGPAVEALQACRRADPGWSRAGEAQLLLGQAMLASGNKRGALASWQPLIRRSPRTRVTDQAQYKLAQLATVNGDFAQAASHYDQILRSGKDATLIPFALYGQGWSLIQLNRYDEALPALDQMLREHTEHQLRNDAILARGITLRNLNRLEDARIDLEHYLAVPPRGTNLGHTLYELALIDQQQKRPEKAAQRLQRLANEVPDYPSMEKVLYELGWSHRESGNDAEAVKQFSVLIDRYGETPLAAEAAYFVGQTYYRSADWKPAAKYFSIAARFTDEADLSEKAHYRLGWSYFKDQAYEPAEAAFERQFEKHADGKLALDAMMMVGECRFKRTQYREALQAYSRARRKIEQADDNANSIRDPAERQVRELVLLHGGQSAAQLKQWQDAVEWLAQLRRRFPATTYLPQAFYETGFAYQQTGDAANALKFYAEVANNYRNEVAARARFMMGEIYFGQRQFDEAIPEFQRVMFGFGAEQAPAGIKNWQAKSGFEAGRCCELLIQQARTRENQDKAL
ncbi:MAG: tetratricopeptide repeat protein, partial [Pirellulales bacterium]|nr:tetratricopeptide repeat protein [Pirellulales bacterium]